MTEMVHMQGKPVAYLVLTAELLANLPHLPWTLMGETPTPGDLLVVVRNLVPAEPE